MPPGADAVVPLERHRRRHRAGRDPRSRAPGRLCIRRGRRGRRPAPRCWRPARISAPRSSACWPPSAATGSTSGRGHASSCCPPASELVEPGQPLARGQIPDSNSALLTAAAIEAGAIALPRRHRAGRARRARRHARGSADPRRRDRHDRRGQRRRVRRRQGGAEPGRHGAVRPSRDAAGMPQGFGTIGPDKTPFFGLPGNPVSAYVSFEVVRAPRAAPDARRRADHASRSCERRCPERLTLAGREALVPARRGWRSRTAPTRCGRWAEPARTLIAGAGRRQRAHRRTGGDRPPSRRVRRSAVMMLERRQP